MTFYRLTDLTRTGAAPPGASEERPAIHGRRLEVGYYHYPAGTIKPPHRHPEEQVVVVVRGRLGYRVAGETRILGPGEAVCIASGVEHDNWALDEDVEFISCKNRL